jgi:WD40 repeat protein
MTQFFDAFISYGRADSKAFATKLYNCLHDRGFGIWFDQNDIPLGVDFQNQIDDGIEKAHNFLFIIAPHSVNSPYCLKEIELAIRRNKRIIPLLHVEQIDRATWQQRQPQGTDEEWEAYKAKGLHSSFNNMHPAIGKINWVYFREGIDDFEKSFSGLIELLQRHADYVAQHTQFLAKALEWEQRQKQHSYLLIADEKQQAESWLEIRFKDEQAPCIPTDLHCEYITESIKNANNLMTQVFVSYAEEDRSMMEKIRNSLRRKSLTVWTNKTDIQIGETWEEAIRRGIEQADNVLYLLSPDSIDSYEARTELEIAVSLNKRIIPVLVRELSTEKMPEGLRELQYIDLTDNVADDDYLLDESQLLKILYEDEDYYNEHKILLAKALKWQRQSENPSILLRGYNLRSAEAWLKVAQTRSQHRPTPLQEAFIAASLQQPPAESLNVFISYSRADSDLARKLNEALQIQGKTTWFDQESIASGTDFAEEIKQGIRASDNFLFILSPRSLKSPYCAQEVEYAAALKKRFVTVLHQPIEPTDLHPELAKVQWIEFAGIDRDFNANFNQLVRTIDTDRDHLRSHTKWSQRALEWEENKKTKDLLLRGSELAVAEAWLKATQAQKKQPAATELQKDYIARSGGYQHQNRRLLTGTVMGVMGVVTAFWLRAEGIATIATLRESAARAQLLLPIDPMEALILAIQATGESRSSWFTSQQVLPPVQSILRDAIGDARERNLLQVLPLYEGEVRSVAISPDGKTIVSGSEDGTVRLWDKAGNAIGQPFQGHKGEVRSVAFSPDGKTIVSGGQDGTIRLWDKAGNAIGQPFQGHKGEVRSVAFSPDGKTIVSGGDDGTIRLWDKAGNAIGQPFQGHKGEVNSVAFSPDGKTIVSGGDDGTIRLWDRAGNPIGQPFTGHEDAVFSVAIGRDGQTIVSGGQDGTIRLWDRSGNAIGQPLKGHEDAVISVAIGRDGQTIVSGSSDGTIRLWDRADNAIGQPFQGHEFRVNSVAIGPDGQTIVSGGDDGTIRLWDRADNAIGQPFQGYEDGVSSVAISPDGKTIVSGGWDGTIHLWDRAGNAIGQPFQGYEDGVSSVAISPDGQTIVSGGQDGTIRLWDRSGNAIGQPFKGYEGTVFSVAISPDGQTIVSGGWDGTIRLWDRAGNPIGQPFQGHKDTVFSVAIGPDGQTLVSSSYDKTIHLWDRSGNPIGQPLKGHEGTVFSVAISPDGQTIVSGGWDKTIRLWDRSGNPIGQPLKGHEDVVISVAFSQDGKTISSGSYDGIVRLWRGGNWLDWLKVGCDRLIAHPIFVTPETLLKDDTETISVAQEAAQTCQKFVWNNSQTAQFRFDRGRAIAQQGDFKGAMKQFQQAHQLSPNIQVPTEEEVGWWAAGGLVESGEQLAQEGQIEEAVRAYRKAQQLKPTWKLYAESWHTLCWSGIKHQEVAQVMDACERAVALAPNNGAFLESRGIAKALMKDYPGAIEDLQASLGRSDSDEEKQKRQRWIDALKKSENPFTKEEIEKL